MEGWSRVARLLMWTWMRLSDALEALSKINKDHAVEFMCGVMTSLIILHFQHFHNRCPSLMIHESFCKEQILEQIWLLMV